ncbi:MAG TPA: T9SS type A sorting domain-containing protein [Bacteroidia bacterium]|nr:T9SS type A sorting domain-containing protein [Bacteroidia bacterium]
MKKISALILICFTLIAKADYWTQKASFGYAMAGAAGFAIGNTGYIGTGVLNTLPVNLFRAYNPATNFWTSKAMFGGLVRCRGTGISIDSLGYIGLGIGLNNDLQDWWQYNPATNTWTQKADFGGGPTRDVASFSIGSFGYVATGGVNYSNQLWRYDPASNAWMQMTNFGGAGRQLAVGFAADGKGYVGTGFNGTSLSDFWQYDPLSDSWSQKAGLPASARWAATGFSIGNKGYIGMGIQNFTAFQDFWEYNTVTNSWLQKAVYGGGGIHFAAQFSIGNKGYAGTGMDGGNNLSNSFWEYTPGNTTGITESQDSGTRFQVYPNPAKELIVINYSLIKKEDLEITITDVQGQKIYIEQHEAQKPESETKINISNFSSGIYFVEISHACLPVRQGKPRMVKKFVKE